MRTLAYTFDAYLISIRNYIQALPRKLSKKFFQLNHIKKKKKKEKKKKSSNSLRHTVR